ncbi:unnamed protein product [Tilletia laevis]|uniref:6-phosphogluconate dehydrogenase NADP-binding domain-containing protein n=3 Tax=Tilletia TaxID=13289 RepID=A0A8X7MZ45_9BASI|nr:hypothetical protein CF336_g3107 [Tilletia laevis]KAE8197306.1 hypothetical protein CF328_g3890 [Tilletia controversa]KAE8261145.1 hypothetical protein A4X03_0g3503 [Tilletia caries]KAE8202611.1 hypothetical protein CF335_g3351 [Tilletia laevis]KAE8253168.1 hypothetical protein A4X06_0g1652 [Tilletia controversa]
MSTFSQVGWVGLGNMGGPMAKNLAKHLAEQKQKPLLTFNRTTSKITELASSLPDAIKPASSASQIGEECDLIFTSLAADGPARSVVGEILEGIKKSGGKGRKVIIVETSTISAETAHELSQAASAVEGVSYVQSPAFGPPPMAVEGKLVFVISGPEETKKAVEPYMVPAMGRKTMDLGSDVRKSTTFKLVGNGFIAGLIELLAESMTLANAAGVGDEAFLGFIKEFVPAPSAIGYGSKMVNSAFDAQPNGFAIDGGLKDVNHILALGKQTGTTLPILEIIKKHMESVREMEEGAGTKLDWSAVVAAQRVESGMSAWKDGKKDSSKM